MNEKTEQEKYEAKPEPQSAEQINAVSGCNAALKLYRVQPYYESIMYGGYCTMKRNKLQLVEFTYKSNFLIKNKEAIFSSKKKAIQAMGEIQDKHMNNDITFKVIELHYCR